MRRLAAIFLSSVAFVLLAVPALATEGETDPEPAVEESFGEGQWDGMLAAAAVAAVMGLIVFAMSNSGVKDVPVDEHH
jgi:hypothetical protein